MAKKYYWLKLKRDFFKRHDIKIIEDMPNGKDYLLFYMKLLVESIDHDGNLRFSDTIPYNDAMLASITNTNIDIVRSAIKIFSGFNMIDMLDNGTLYMNQIEGMIGSETEWAEKKRIYKKGKSPDNVPQMSDKSIEKESRVKSIDKDIRIEKKTRAKRSPTLVLGTFKNVLLEQKELDRLNEVYEARSVTEAINALSKWLEGGKKREDHYKCLTTWALGSVNAVEKKKLEQKPHYDLDTHCPYCYANFQGTITLLPKTYDASYTCKCGASGKDIAEVIRNKKGA